MPASQLSIKQRFALTKQCCWLSSLLLIYFSLLFTDLFNVCFVKLSIKNPLDSVCSIFYQIAVCYLACLICRGVSVLKGHAMTSSENLRSTCRNFRMSLPMIMSWDPACTFHFVKWSSCSSGMATWALTFWLVRMSPAGAVHTTLELWAFLTRSFSATFRSLWCQRHRCLAAPWWSLALLCLAMCWSKQTSWDASPQSSVIWVDSVR